MDSYDLCKRFGYRNSSWNMYETQTLGQRNAVLRVSRWFFSRGQVSNHLVTASMGADGWWGWKLRVPVSQRGSQYALINLRWFFKVKGMNLSYFKFLREYMWQCHGQWWQCSPFFFSGKSVARPWRFLPLALAESAQQPWRQRQRHGDSAGESQTFPQRSYWWAVMPGDGWIHVKFGRCDCSSTHAFILVFSEKFMKLPEKL